MHLVARIRSLVPNLRIAVNSINYMKRTFAILIFLVSGVARTQQPLSLSDLSAFNNPGKNWQIAGNVTASLQNDNSFSTENGQGILVNVPLPSGHGADLYTKDEFADLDLELEFMMARGSNSGIYLQGRYELQLLDSWASMRNSPGDNGGIYERWDESRGKDNEGFDGHAPRQNVSRAPGLWQQLRIVFQAPRFDGTGKKTENAKMLRVELNGVLIHENVELAGVTRGASSAAEGPAGPLRFQGDHGAVAFRNIRLKNYSQLRPEIVDLQYKVFSGRFDKMPSPDTMKAEGSGATSIISSAVHKKDNDFLLYYTGKLVVKSPGEYHFKLHTSGGTGELKINREVVKAFGSTDTKPITLQPGTYPLELAYAKYINWERNSLGLTISSDDVREFLISDAGSIIEEAVDPILVDAASNTIVRSFVDIPPDKRIVHAVNVGSSRQLHFTYDLDRGSVVQAWRGGFLDATPMWHDRGDGSSRPLGSVMYFGSPYYSVRKLQDASSAWPEDSTGTSFTVKGYEVDTQNNPTFHYLVYGARISDVLRVSEDGKSISRKVSISDSPGSIFMKVAEGKSIENVAGGLYLVDDKKYYIRLADDSAKPLIQTRDGKREMLLPLQSEINYSILF
jgi:hypothetical protein